MTNQKFELALDAPGQALLVDALRYENEELSRQISAHDSEMARLREELDKALQDLDALQQLVDMQNAEWYAKKSEGNGR